MSSGNEEGEPMVISSSDDEGLIVVNDSALTADDLPLGEHEEENRQAATRICELLNEHGKSMPRPVRDQIIRMLKDGDFHHTAASKIRPSEHQLCQKMWDSEVMSPNWINITYENWFILSGVYDQKKLSEISGVKGIMKALVRRYGYDLSNSLAYKNGPLNAGLHAREFVTQTGSILSDLVRKFAKQELQIEKLLDRVGALELEVKQLRDQNRDGYSVTNDGSYDMDCYGNMDEDGDYDDDVA
ncbi:hypothetical protein FAVG1_07128 [Fusarium avenaceum]|nr:hypothetical protein FAVG1_07128 [Fusarium avenaceum]